MHLRWRQGDRFQGGGSRVANGPLEGVTPAAIVLNEVCRSIHPDKLMLGLLRWPSTSPGLLGFRFESASRGLFVVVIHLCGSDFTSILSLRPQCVEYY